MFDHGEVSVAPSEPPALDALRQRISTLESGAPARLSVPTHPSLAPVLQLRAGAVYAVDSAQLAVRMMAGASAAGEWAAVIGWPDLGIEAALELGVEPTRTVLVPEPGELWLEAVGALIDVVKVVVLRPPPAVAARGVDARSARVLEARLRKRSAVLVVWGAWPRPEARLEIEQSRWSGPERGEGRLRQRRLRIAVRRGAAPPRHAELRIGANELAGLDVATRARR